MKIIPFQKDHLKHMIRDGLIEGIPDEFIESVFEAIEKNCSSYSAEQDGQIIACAGLTELSPGRALAWSYLPPALGGMVLLRITRACERMLKITEFRRIEMDVLYDYDDGHRWAKVLGFELEAPRRAGYGPDGRDYALYARVRK